MYPRLMAAGQLSKVDSASLPIGEADEQETVIAESNLSPATSVSERGQRLWGDAGEACKQEQAEEVALLVS